MRIRRQAGSAAQFVAEVQHLFFAETAFQIGARVNAGRRVPLEIDEVAGLIAVARVEKVIEANFQQRRQRGVGRDVAADPGILFVLAMHHGHRVPADQALDAALQKAIAGIRDFFFNRNGVDVRRVQLHRNLDARLAGAIHQRGEQIAATIVAVLVDDLIEGFEPFGNFFFGINLGIRWKLDYGMNFVYGHLFPQPIVRKPAG